jgi:hypothetical protein
VCCGRFDEKKHRRPTGDAVSGGGKIFLYYERNRTKFFRQDIAVCGIYTIAAVIVVLYNNNGDGKFYPKNLSKMNLAGNTKAAFK